MRAERIEEILSKHGLVESRKLSLALEEILTSYSKDRDLAKNVAETISRRERQDKRAKGIRYKSSDCASHYYLVACTIIFLYISE